MSEEANIVAQKPQVIEAPLSLNEQGLFAAKNTSDVQRIGRSALASRALPNHISDIHVFCVAWNVLSGMGLQPMSFMDKTWWNPQSNTLGVEVQAALSAVQNHPDFEGMTEWLVDDKYTVIDDSNFMDADPKGAICIIRRRGRPEVKARFSMKQAQGLGLANKHNWKNQPGNMLKVRARGLALKEQFGDVIGGVVMKGYDEYGDAPDEQAPNGHAMSQQQAHRRPQNAVAQSVEQARLRAKMQTVESKHD